MGIAGVYPQDVVDAGTLEVGDKVIVIRGNYIFAIEVDELPSGGGGGSSVTIVDNLESTSTTDALSANQGKVLNDRLETVEQEQLTTMMKKITVNTDDDIPAFASLLSDYMIKVKSSARNGGYSTTYYFDFDNQSLNWIPTIGV